jgi:thiamine-phosphate pyrophosphorylase
VKPDPERFSGVHVLADDDPRWRHDPVTQAHAACRGGAAVVQLRAKHATDRTTLGWAREIRAATRDAGVLFVVNDRFDLALLAEADAVHLGQDDLPPERLPDEARRALGVGRSTHTLAQAQDAAGEPVDYVAFGPLFGTGSKDSEYDARGLEALREVVGTVGPRPLVAIGGIDLAGARRAREAGASGVAVISAVAGSDDPEAATRALVAALAEGSA